MTDAGKRPGLGRVRRIVIGAVVVLTMAQSLNAVLSISSFEKTYRQSLISNYRILTRELKNQVERDVSFGRPIYLIGGIDRIFESVIDQDENIERLYVTFPDRRIIYSTNPDAVGMRLGSDDFPVFAENPSQADLSASAVTEFRGAFFVSAPVYYDESELVGSVHLEFSRSLITNAIRSVIQDNARFFVPILLISIVIIAGIITGISRYGGSGGGTQLPASVFMRRNTIAIVGVLLLGQLSYAYFNNRYFEQADLEIFENNADTVAAIVANDLDRVLSYGLPIDRLRKAEDLIEQGRINSPETDSIYVTNRSGEVLYAATPEGVVGILGESAGLAGIDRIDTTQTQVRRVTPLDVGGVTRGFLIAYLNEELIARQLRELLLDILTVIVVSVIFSLEMVRLLSLVVKDEGEESSESTTNLNVVRLTSFIFFFAALIPLSFLPAFIEEIYRAHPIHMFGFSTETIISLPISSYMLGVAVFIPVVGFLSGRLSIRRIFFIAGGLFIVGTFMTAVVTHIGMLIFARFIAGLGYGGVITNSTNLVIAATTEKNRSTGFGIWAAGFAAATICAISIGGVIVSRLGFSVGMLTATGFAVVMLIFITVNVQSGVGVKEKERNDERVGLREFFVLFKNRSLVVNLIFSSVPFSLAYIGLFQYVFPLYMGSKSISQANIGRILTVYGLISLATPLISRIADRARNEKFLIVVGNSITGLSLVLFYLLNRAQVEINPVLVLIPVILGMGLGGMMIDAVEESFITSSKEAREMGEAKLLSLYTTYDKIISIVVPVLAGTLITAFGYSTSIGVIGAFTLLGVIIFAMFSKNLRQLAVSDA